MNTHIWCAAPNSNLFDKKQYDEKYLFNTSPTARYIPIQCRIRIFVLWRGNHFRIHCFDLSAKLRTLPSTDEKTQYEVVARNIVRTTRRMISSMVSGAIFESANAQIKGSVEPNAPHHLISREWQNWRNLSRFTSLWVFLQSQVFALRQEVSLVERCLHFQTLCLKIHVNFLHCVKRIKVRSYCNPTYLCDVGIYL